MNLVSLDFTRCDLTGTIPAQLGDLSNLAILGLGRNDFTSTIPKELGKLSNLGRTASASLLWIDSITLGFGLTHSIGFANLSLSWTGKERFGRNYSN